MSCKIHSHLLPPPQSAIKDRTPNNAPNNKEIELPTHITSNLKKELRDYQKQAIDSYLEKRQFNPTQKHFMFEMATGSGKTLVMAGLILECYKQGYQNFIFFVNSASILEKTKLNFTDSVSSKYLFSENININDENTEIKSINNLNESHNNAINIYFSTIQGLFSLFTRAKENAITLEDLKDQKLVFLADEAHHLNTETKKKLNDSEASEKRNWESVVKLALEQNKDNLLLEFSATIPKEKSVEDKYENLKVVTYTLKQFSEDKFCKNIYSLSYENKELETRFLGACVSSLYKELLAQHHNIENFKPCILFKSERIEESKKNQERFNAFLENLSFLDLENFFNHSRNAFFKAAKSFFDEQNHTPNLVALLQNKFKESVQINTNNEKELEKSMLLLNSLEDRDNPKRVIFSVDKLNEGWDVLNLFDIVRLKNKANQKDTIKDAQLIGRGARYYPFSYNDFKPSRIEFYQRKFDLANPLSTLERLDYHAIYNSEFIAKLNKGLQDLGLGLIEKEKTTIPLTPTKRFKCYYASNTKDKKKNLFNMDYSDPVEAKLKSLHVPLFAFGVREKQVDFKEENKGDRTYYMPHTLDKIPINYFLKALNLKNLDFKTLKKAFKKHAFNNKVGFIEQYISPLKTNFHKNQKFDDNKILLQLAVYIIENLKDTLLKEQDKPSVSTLELKEFETHNKSLSASEWEKDIPPYEWLLFKDMRKLDSDLEREFLGFINDHKELLDKKFKEWCVLRNDYFTELKVFCNIEGPFYAQGFEPDFILFAQTHEDEFLGFTCYMEVKGEHLEPSNAWKKEFLEMLENATLKSHNKKLHLKGLPFFTLHNSVFNGDFQTAFHQTFKDKEC
ncbi:DEAD/DEAH box helicase family protein [Helicobacter pylori]|uniref:DEAD/DEAH box helicase family protein n=1 Tax=Helicobacter pylori TaxID=210 RepID=UPI0009AED4BA|nr:DEAD/DEAH box helicase family protein [Helicobacter pylori]AVL48451.1 restriction endonuclease [Helicobacter pylori]MWR20312.1 DEAD/DEAH box helicase [Helicobacter pylori]MWR36081.1 DEAD/DEAH box helicase [Helicobacter pylori]NPT20614.1 DEAD/DEAH box helicase family protein [Helicobacter pylori]ORJ08427.1 restriction endonuclease [Helicobacter pylori]